MTTLSTEPSNTVIVSGRSRLEEFMNRIERTSASNSHRKDTEKSEESSLLLRFGARYYHIEYRNIAYIYRRENVNVLVTKDGEKFPVHMTMSELLKHLNPSKFSRMSVDLIASIESIKGLVKRGSAGLCIDLSPDLGLEFKYDTRYSSNPVDYRQLIQNIRTDV